ncbi:hypothetical protein MKEN_00905900 [Mycena kentingensis (nom. inval.)]|nr:hypothetical protein MKEN_00905900 [Mycena kentingensis (nom. inval.)]
MQRSPSKLSPSKAYATPSASPIPATPHKRRRTSSTPRPEIAEFQRGWGESERKWQAELNQIEEKYTRRPPQEEDLVDITTFEIVKDRGVLRAKLSGMPDVDDLDDEPVYETDEDEEEVDELDLLATLHARARSLAALNDASTAENERLLAQFLADEKRRKALCGEDEEDDDAEGKAEDSEQAEEDPSSESAASTPQPLESAENESDVDELDDWGEGEHNRVTVVLKAEEDQTDEAEQMYEVALSPTPMPPPPPSGSPKKKGTFQLATPPQSRTSSEEEALIVATSPPSPSKTRKSTVVPSPTPTPSVISLHTPSPEPSPTRELSPELGCSPKYSVRKEAPPPRLKKPERPQTLLSPVARRYSARKSSSTDGLPDLPVASVSPKYDRKGKGRLREPDDADTLYQDELEIPRPWRKANKLPARPVSPPIFEEGSSRSKAQSPRKRKRRSSSSSEGDDLLSSPTKPTSSRDVPRASDGTIPRTPRKVAGRSQSAAPPAPFPAFPFPSFPSGPQDPHAMQFFSHILAGAYAFAMSAGLPYSYPTTPHHEHTHPHVHGSGATLPPSSPAPLSPSPPSSPVKPALVQDRAHASPLHLQNTARKRAMILLKTPSAQMGEQASAVGRKRQDLLLQRRRPDVITICQLQFKRLHNALIELILLSFFFPSPFSLSPRQRLACTISQKMRCYHTVLPLLALGVTRAAVIPVRRQDAASQKMVVAHFMVGNTFPYTPQDWQDDINLALASGIDGFALNVGPDDFQKNIQTNNAFDAADAQGTFKLFFSLDMSVLPCQTFDDGASLRKLVLDFATRPSHLQFDGKAFVSTFAGESCKFGTGSPAEGWSTQFAAHPDIQGKIHFAPSFFIDPATFNQFAGTFDGAFNFNSGWPVDLSVDLAKSITSDLGSTNDAGTNALNKFLGSTDTDLAYINSLASFAPAGKRLSYMAAVSPWFFTHFGADTFNKNFMFLADQHLYAQRWENIIGLRDQIDLVEIATWNDYGESHYIGPIKGALPPTSETFVNGFPHQAFLDLTKHFATQFKTGAAPAIEKDQIFMWARPHPAFAQAPDPIGAPRTFELTQDNAWAVVLASADGEVTLSTSAENTKTFQVTAGVNKLAIPIVPGGTLNAQLNRGGATVVNLATPGTDFTFNGAPTTFNYNIFVAGASS